MYIYIYIYTYTYTHTYKYLYVYMSLSFTNDFPIHFLFQRLHIEPSIRGSITWAITVFQNERSCGGARTDGTANQLGCLVWDL